MNFLPNDYQAPKKPSNYTKLEEGVTKIRILTAPIMGYEDWDNKKPVRFRMNNKPSTSLDPTKPFRHFWAFIIWNYKTERMEIFQVTQTSIRDRIESLAKDEDWGDPFHYDIKITKTGQQVNTKYEINPCGKAEIPPGMMHEFEAKPIDLNELYTNGDPFAATTEYRTKGFWEEPQPVKAAAGALMSKNQVEEIEGQIEMFIAVEDPKWRDQSLAVFKKSKWSEVESKYYEAVMKRIEAKKASLLLDPDSVPF